MPSVDNRVVRMEFDNAAFERKLDTTIASLAKLNKALQMEGAQKGLTGVSAAADKVHFGGLTSGLESVSKGFLALATVGITALANLTTAAMHAGVQILQHLTSPIKEGFQEYETNLNSIQTILANTAAKGTSMEQVTGALDKLNVYSDKTIYNFGQMAKNIGTFTAAGVDLDQSVNAIKGIANLSAMSGSNAEQASSAMYQMSQAMASGTLKAQDWISVVNSGIGGQVFQDALYQSAKAVGTLKDVPLDQTFDEWKASGGNFREAMAEGIFTSEVLGITLEGFTGDLTAAELAAKGFSEAQIGNIQKTAAVAQAAATEVKTFTQLLGTVKESVATGWADSMKIIIGDFGEAKHTWTALNTGISNFVKKNSEARNELLKGWDALGGRAALIEGFHSAITNIGTILGTVSKAFRDIFPKQTAEQLFSLTESFVRFTKALQPSEKTIENITRVVHGLASVFKIAWTVVKEGVWFFKELFATLTGGEGGKFLEFVADIADVFTKLGEKLVNGKLIASFFEDLAVKASKLGPIISDLKKKISEFFGGQKEGAEGTDETGDSVGRLEQRFNGIKDMFGKLGGVGDAFSGAMQKVAHAIDQVLIKINEFREKFKAKLDEVFGPGTFSGSLDLINTGLLAGITAIFFKFFKEGFKFDIGDGLFEKVGKSFEELTGVLTAMQTSIKADALLKIAGAIAILTASVLVLSLIDSDALTKALTAMAIGFAQLMAAFAIITKISAGPKAALTFDMIALGMNMMATSILILAAAAKVLASLNWDELARGLTGVGILMGIIVIATRSMGDPKEMILTAAGMLVLSFALMGLSKVVQAFADMSWEEMIRGFAGVAVGLAIITIGMRAMPDNMERIGLGLLGVAKAMDMMVGVVSAFAALSLVDTAQGLLALGITMQVLASGLKQMPQNLPSTALGLLLVSIALMAIQKVIESFGGMSVFEIAKGLITLSISLTILSVALKAMSSSMMGAAALIVAAVALNLLARAVQEFAEISLGDLLKGLLGIAAVLATLAVAALLMQPALPAMLAMGAALALIGVGLSLFGIGAEKIARAFETLSKVSKEGSENITRSLEAIGAALPTLAIGFAKAILEIIAILLSAAPKIILKLIELGGKLIEGLASLLPKLGELIISAITTLLNVIVTMYPRFIEAGIQLILALLNGIRNHIGEVVIVVGQIVVEFINGLAVVLPQIIAAGVNLLVSFIQGITDNLSKIMDAVGTLITTFINEMTALQLRIVGAGVDLLVALLKGISDNLQKVINAVGEIIAKFISGMGENAQKIIDEGGTVIIKLIEGFGKKAEDVITAGKDAVLKFIEGLGKNAIELATGAAKVLTDFLDALATAIDENAEELRGAGARVVGAIINGMTGGLAEKAKGVAEGVVGVAKDAVGAAKGFLQVVGDPYSLVFMGIGESMMNGMSMALDADASVEQSAVGVVQRSTSAFENSFAKMTAELGELTEFNPTITPVLDLTRVAADAKQIAGYIQTSQKLAPEYSYAQARTIASSANAQQAEEIKAPAGAGEVTFNQTINAPTQLSTTDIYRQTRNQITLAKQELSIP